MEVKDATELIQQRLLCFLLTSILCSACEQESQQPLLDKLGGIVDLTR